MRAVRVVKQDVIMKYDKEDISFKTHFFKFRVKAVKHIANIIIPQTYEFIFINKYKINNNMYKISKFDLR